jgi:hypothetical protein
MWQFVVQWNQRDALFIQFTLMPSNDIYIYIYIYMCVCVSHRTANLQTLILNIYW